ncbi:hypothetical protein RBSWK_00836 [Rhodopirellula baltica SWK14]|uniref:Uncharacterized protein n=1 Tax=Rhodopirellula baltica SWK14 TaxID=993516 RepID=L7CMF9_RHOBT|nr:hypothetical protein RBSWK_00836 [Rhodopirellula baltica SWK14]
MIDPFDRQLFRQLACKFQLSKTILVAIGFLDTNSVVTNSA